MMTLFLHYGSKLFTFWCDDDILFFILSCRVETVPWSNFQESSSCSQDEEGMHLRCSDWRGTARFAASGVSISTDPLCKKRVSGVFWGASVRVSCLFGSQLNRILSSPCGRCTNSHHRAHVFKDSGTKSRPSHHLYLSCHCWCLFKGFCPVLCPATGGEVDFWGEKSLKIGVW